MSLSVTNIISATLPPIVDLSYALEACLVDFFFTPFASLSSSIQSFVSKKKLYLDSEANMIVGSTGS